MGTKEKRAEQALRRKLARAERVVTAIAPRDEPLDVTALRARLEMERRQLAEQARAVNEAVLAHVETMAASEAALSTALLRVMEIRSGSESVDVLEALAHRKTEALDTLRAELATAKDDARTAARIAADHRLEIARLREEGCAPRWFRGCAARFQAALDAERIEGQAMKDLRRLLRWGAGQDAPGDAGRAEGLAARVSEVPDATVEEALRVLDTPTTAEFVAGLGLPDLPPYDIQGEYEKALAAAREGPTTAIISGPAVEEDVAAFVRQVTDAP